MLLRRGKPAWKPQFVKVDRKNINFYDSEKDPSDKPASFVELENLYHVRGATQADIPRSPAVDIPKIFQIIYSPSGEVNNSGKKIEPRMQFLLAKNAQEQALWVQRLSKKVPKAMGSRTPSAPSVNPEKNNVSKVSQSYVQMPGINAPSTPTNFASSTNIIRSHSPNNHPAISIQRAHSSASYGNHYPSPIGGTSNLNYSHSTQSPNRIEHQNSRNNQHNNNRLMPDRQYH